MKTILYKIQFFTYWHASSGLAAGTDASALIIRDKDNLPVIPGKTLKGLLREAAEQLCSLGKVSEHFCQSVFGKVDGEITITEDNQGKAFFSSAELSGQVAKSITNNQQQRHLYEKLSSTRIDDNGLAEEHSLRTIEVTVPLTVYAKIEDFPEEEKFDDYLLACFQWVKRLGLNRNRGLGRCKFSLVS